MKSSSFISTNSSHQNNFRYHSPNKLRSKHSSLNHSLSLIVSPERVRSNILKSDRIKKQLQSFISSLKTALIEDSLNSVPQKPITDFNKLILTFDVKLITSSSPTKKFVEKGNLISHINFQHSKNKNNSPHVCYYENQRKNSIENFVKGLKMGRYKGLYK